MLLFTYLDIFHLEERKTIKAFMSLCTYLMPLTVVLTSNSQQHFEPLDMVSLGKISPSSYRTG